MGAVAKAAELDPIQETRIAGRYLIRGRIGAGGMASVYRALDETTGRDVALKLLNASLARSRRKTAEALFEREYHTLMRLKHPRIIEAYDYGLTPTGPYYTMELLDGKDLNQLGALKYPEACRLLRDVASSLALIHAHRLVHRDVSPRNIRLTQVGRAKLLDFGALSPFGVADDLIGTPLCMAPELIYAQPLDQRTDLYSLGAVAYWLLTGRHAYPARRMQDLLLVWETPPVPPSQYAPELPRALEALVLSLLSLDPLGRPPNGAAVIDQLTAIAGLEPEEHEHTAESYLLSSRVVGRHTELDWIDKRVKRALVGNGAQVMIEGAPGIGKTCILREASLAARLRGAVALKADSHATAEPFGVAASLALDLLDACPDVARRAAAEHAGLLARISPELRDKLGEAPAEKVPDDANERRARFQTALHAWFMNVARERVLFIAVDNVQAADDNSAAFLAALGRESRSTQLVVVATLRTGERVVAEAAVRMLRQRSSRLKLASLGAEACEQLVKSLFGDVPNSARVAKLLFEKSAGVPQQCMDLAQLLVQKKIAKYAAGTWVLPQDVAEDELPNRAEELLATRLTGLSPAARELADALSIHSKPVTLERCLALVEGQSEGAIYAALDEMVAEQILRSEGGSYRFAHDAVRLAVAEKLDDSRRRASHVRAAEALLASAPDDIAAQIEAAMHLLTAGAESRGAEMLAKLGMGLSKAVDFNAGAEAVVALQRALEGFERQNRSEYEIASILFPMMKLAYYSPHWKLVLEHGERALEIGMRITGLTLANRLRKVFGPKRALKAGLALAGVRFAREQKRGLGYDLKTAIISSCSILPAIVGTAATCLDTARVARIKRIVEPLQLFGPEHVAGILYNWAPNQLLVASGREGEALESIERCIVASARPHVRETMGEANWRSQHGGLLFVRALFETYSFGNGALGAVEELEQLGIRVWAMAADQIRMLYHAFRGESEDVQRYRERVELFAVQGSTTWQAEMFWPAIFLSADVLTGDAIAARRTAEQLARRAKDVDVLQKYADAARASYLMVRGELDAAIELFDRTMPGLPLRGSVAYERIRSFFAQALNLAGEHERAKVIAQEIIARMVDADRRMVHFIEPQRQLALAEAGLGNFPEALRILHELLTKHGAEDNRLIVGLLHKARAEVALSMGDAAACETHMREMEQRFRSTRNPALIAQCERMLERVARLGIGKLELTTPEGGEAMLGYSALVSGTVAELSAAADPASYALQLIMTRVRASTGFLYIRRQNGLELVAASGPSAPPEHLEATLKELAEKAHLTPERREPWTSVPPASHLGSTSSRSTTGATSTTGSVGNTSSSGHTSEQESCETALVVPTGSSSSSQRNSSDEPEFDETQGISDAKTGRTVFVNSVPPPNPWGGYQLLLLDARQGDQRIVVGGLILEAKAPEVARLSKELLKGMARVLLNRHVTTAYGTVHQ